LFELHFAIISFFREPFSPQVSRRRHRKAAQTASSQESDPLHGQSRSGVDAHIQFVPDLHDAIAAVCYEPCRGSRCSTWDRAASQAACCNQFQAETCVMHNSKYKTASCSNWRGHIQGSVSQRDELQNARAHRAQVSVVDAEANEPDAPRVTAAYAYRQLVLPA
jgi:hypothetical protein